MEIIGAVRAIARTADQIATRTIARLEFDVIGTRGDRASDNREGAITVNFGQDSAKIDLSLGFGHALPSNRGTVTAAEKLHRELVEGRGECGAEEYDPDLIKLVRCCTRQGKGHRQLLVVGLTDQLTVLVL